MKKTKGLQYYEAVGRRKAAVARVRLYIVKKDKSVTIDGMNIKAGEIFLNKKPIEQIFPTEGEKNRYVFALRQSQNDNRFAIIIKTKGGGRVGQIEAISHGLARAIEKVDKENYRPMLKKFGLLKRDARVRERRKVGTGGKSRRAKQSPKR